MGVRLWALLGGGLIWLSAAPASLAQEASGEPPSVPRPSESVIYESLDAELVPVTWFHPRWSGTEYGSQILFMGKTIPGARLFLLHPYISKIESGKSRQIFVQADQVLNLPSRAEADGIFNFQLNLEEDGRYEVEVVFLHPRGGHLRNTRFKLNFEVQNQKVSLWAAEGSLEEAVQSTDAERNLLAEGVHLFPDKIQWLTLSLGTSFMSYGKKSQQIPMDAKVSSSQNSWIQLLYERRLRPELLTSLALSYSSGQVSSGPRVQVLEGEHSWLHFQGGLRLYPEALIVKDTPLSQIRAALLAGLTYESLPYLKSLTAFAEQGMREAQLLSAYLGGQLDLRHHRDWKWWVRGLLYSPQFSLSSTYDIQGGLATDFALGADYVLPDRRWAVGAEASVHWRALSTHENDIYAGQDVSTEQSFLSITTGLRLSHAF